MHWQSWWRLKEWVHALDADIGVRAKSKNNVRHLVSSESITGEMKHQLSIPCLQLRTLHQYDPQL
jgi:hypothetical protein